MPLELMLATLSDRREFGDDWLLERKFDGERCVARKHGSEVRLESRTAKDLTGAYPEVRAAVAGQRDRELVLDGEVVAFDGDQTSFSRLQQRLGVAGPLPSRWRRIRSSTASSTCSSSTATISETGRCSSAARGWRPRSGPARHCSSAKPGVTTRSSGSRARAGRAGRGSSPSAPQAPYVSGRSRDWLKLKCAWGQELVVGGYTDPAGSRTDFGALLVGYYEDGRLRYAGKVGTGYSAATLRDLGARLRALETPASAVRRRAAGPRGTHWTRPELVAQIGFAEWTNDGRLRQPRFLGLRDDKRPTEVVRERSQ